MYGPKKSNFVSSNRADIFMLLLLKQQLQADAVSAPRWFQYHRKGPTPRSLAISNKKGVKQINTVLYNYTYLKVVHTRFLENTKSIRINKQL
jgi:hypothetical protein